MNRQAFTIADCAEPQLRNTLLPGGTAGEYDGLDRFGRVKDHLWLNYGTSTNLVRIQHGYDYVGNRIYRYDPIATANSVSLDEYYTYDGLNQLKDLKRGQLTTDKDGISGTAAKEEAWTLDGLGNWSEYVTQTSGTTDLDQVRSHDLANEITQIDSSTSHVAYDASGNMTKLPKPGDWTDHYCAVYDAWNRLVEVRASDNSTVIAQYQYDGRNYRTVKKTYTSGTLSETRHFYYNNSWQILEERLESDSVIASYADRQNVWGMRYVDDLILRDRDSDSSSSTGSLGLTSSGLDERLYAMQDPNWNTVAIANASGAVQERYSYTAYGKPTFLTSAFASQSSNTSSYNWDTLYTSRQYDSESGIYQYRNRFYEAETGRFINRDPIQVDINLYRYVRNNPVIYVDPSGLEWVSGREGGQRTRFYHGQWYHWVDTPQQPQTPIIPSQPYASTIDPFSPDFDPNTWSNMHNWDFLGDFLNGTGPTNRFYGPDSLQTFQMRQSPGAAKLRDAFYASGCKGVKPGDPGSSYGTGEAAGGTTGDLSNTAFQVGGFGGATAVDNGNGTVTFTIYNDASRESFLYHGFYIFPVQNYQTGPMRTIRQTFQWTENIDKSKCCEKK